MKKTPLCAVTMKGDKGGIARQITCDVLVSAPFIGSMPSTQSVTVRGLWDTGATGSVITKAVADKIGIKPTGQAVVNHADGTSNQNTYLVNITLPGNVCFQNLKVTEGKITGSDVLIGMDIINSGDFCITNLNGNTIATFRTPSCHQMDYVKMLEDSQIDKYLPRPKKKRKGKRR